MTSNFLNPLVRLNHLVRLAALLSLAGLQALPARATSPVTPQGVLSLSAQAQVEVARDWLTITLSVTREAAQASVVQAQLTQALDGALATARRAARPGQVEVQTGAFSVQPRRGPKGELVAWWGRAELQLQGRDIASLVQLAGRLDPLTVASMAATLSREARQQAEAEAAAQAIARFRAMAAEYTRQFGHAGHTVREVHVGTGEVPPMRPMPMALRAAGGPEDAAIPVEPGQGTVSVTVSGTIQMK